MLKNLVIKDFKDQLASSEPVPGGGAVAALASSLSCALGSMVANLTVGKKGYEEHDQKMQEVIDQMEKSSDEFLDLIDEDANSFSGVMEAFKLPKGTEEEKAARTAKIQEGMKHAAEVPLKIADKMDALFDIFDYLVLNGNKNAQTDSLVGAMLARTAILSALYNVKINLLSIKDSAYVENLKKEIARIEKHATEREKLILAKSDI